MATELAEANERAVDLETKLNLTRARHAQEVGKLKEMARKKQVEIEKHVSYEDENRGLEPV